jgi:hypothetical protein
MRKKFLQRTRLLLFSQPLNNNEAVWRAFEARKRLCELHGYSLPMDEETADALDWKWAERTARPVYAIGFSLL